MGAAPDGATLVGAALFVAHGRIPTAVFVAAVAALSLCVAGGVWIPTEGVLLSGVPVAGAVV